MHYYLGIEVWYKPGEVFLCQGKHIIEILQRFSMMDCKSMATPMVTNLKKLRGSISKLVDPSMYWWLIGMLMYLVNTRPNIYFAMNTLSQLDIESRHEHLTVEKHILRYLCGTRNYGLRYVANKDVQLQRYTDTDWVVSAKDGKSTSRVCFSLRSAMILWMSRK